VNSYEIISAAAELVGYVKMDRIDMRISLLTVLVRLRLAYARVFIIGVQIVNTVVEATVALYPDGHFLNSVLLTFHCDINVEYGFTTVMAQSDGEMTRFSVTIEKYPCRTG
jgi:hypothetical protein